VGTMTPRGHSLFSEAQSIGDLIGREH
jgi:hypothetical protein